MQSTISTFIETYRSEIVHRWIRKVLGGTVQEHPLTGEQLVDSVELFMDQIVDGLRTRSECLVESQLSAAARLHGNQRQVLKQSVFGLVHEYQNLLEAIVEIAAEREQALTVPEVLELVTCLFSGSAEAVDEFTRATQEDRHRAHLEDFAFLAHELRNPLSSAKLAWEILRPDDAHCRTGSLEGRSAAVLTRSLVRLADLVNNRLSKTRAHRS